MSDETALDDTALDGPAADDASAAADLRPGPFAWAVIALGWVVMVVAVAGAWGDDALRGIGSWVRWIIGAALVHDLLLLPVVLAAGWLLTRVVPRPWRVPLRTALLVGGITALAVWPTARRWGARDDNPSILPLPVARNLAILVVVLLVIALVAGVVAARTGKRSGMDQRQDLS